MSTKINSDVVEIFYIRKRKEKIRAERRKSEFNSKGENQSLKIKIRISF